MKLGANRQVPGKKQASGAPMLQTRGPIVSHTLPARPSGAYLRCRVVAKGSESALSQASVSDDGPELTRTPWFKKPCPGFKDVASIEELQQHLNDGGKMAVVDLYAGWCSCCKGAYPSLCKVPSLDGYSDNYNFFKVNIENEDVKPFLKQYEVRGIPHVMVFDTQGNHLIGMGASFKKIDALRKNLEVIAEAQRKGQPLEFRLDPNGFAVPR